MISTPAIILFLPLAVAAIILLGQRFIPGAVRATVCAYLSTASVVVTLILSIFLVAEGGESEIVPLFTWADLGAVKLDIGVKLDSLSRGMIFIVTFIGALVHIFSLGYMKDDSGKARYFAGLSLFMFSMTGIVFADNFAMMFIFWELVGISSYILIGHWYTKDTAAEAAKKAFLTNRIGDFGFMIGILILFGTTNAIAFAGVQSGVENGLISGGLLTVATLCIFCGAVGKSAQFPLHVWLPDAMEGPTPVSALIHAATMVAAGVYMLARVVFLLDTPGNEISGTVIAWTGGITALLAALMATQQDDIKRILAYSTLSQLGYMVMAVGLLAEEAGMFHLYTHAFFKALLFLGSGAVIFACHHEQNIWKMGGLIDRMKITFGTFAVGTAALVAVPATSGFFSKELILVAAAEKSMLLFVVAAGVALLTAFYMTRLLVVTFMGKARTEHADHAKDPPPIMWVPLALLAFFSVFAGFPWFADRLSPLPVESGFHFAMTFEGIGIPLISLGALLVGCALAWKLYAGKDSEPLRIGVFKNKFYFDELYAGLIKWAQDGIAKVLTTIDDLLIDGVAVTGLSRLTAGIGSFLRRVQTGNLQGYAFIFGLGIVIILYIALLRT